MRREYAALGIAIGTLAGLVAVSSSVFGTGASTVARAPVDQGWIAYEDSGGQGPVVLCMPGMGDMRGEYRFLAPLLQQAGYRVLVADLRGHGDSGAAFAHFRPEDSGNDALAVLDHAGVRKATLLGCSMSAGSIVWAATQAPDRIDGLVMLGPAARQGEVSALQASFNAMLYRILFSRPWGPSLWSAFYATLYKKTKPHDLQTYRAALRTMLAQPGRMEALQTMIMASKKAVGDRLPSVKAPTLLVMGGADPDFPDPRQEAETLGRLLGSRTQVEILEGLGHYPHVEDPQAVMGLIRTFLSQLSHGA